MVMGLFSSFLSFFHSAGRGHPRTSTSCSLVGSVVTSIIRAISTSYTERPHVQEMGSSFCLTLCSLSFAVSRSSKVSGLDLFLPGPILVGTSSHRQARIKLRTGRYFPFAVATAIQCGAFSGPKGCKRSDDSDECSSVARGQKRRLPDLGTT